MSPWKKIPTREKNLIFFPWKSNLTREKTSKTTRENMSLPVKIFRKPSREKWFTPVKKPEKGQKKAFTGYFVFHGEKKTLQGGGGCSGRDLYGIYTFYTL